MTNFVFTPTNVSISAGGTIQWTNDSQTSAHTSTQDTPLALWDSGIVGGGESFSFVFTARGNCSYHCIFHFTMGMVGTVSVTIRAAPPSDPVGTKFTATVA